MHKTENKPVVERQDFERYDTRFDVKKLALMWKIKSRKKAGFNVKN